MNEEKTQTADGVASELNAELCVDDKKRLDWLETNTDFTLRFHKKHWRCTRNTEYEFNVYKTMREAIDAAMNGTWQD